MADEPAKSPDESVAKPAATSPDSLGDELLAMGSFGDATPASAGASADGNPDLSELQSLLQQASTGGVSQMDRPVPAARLPETMPFDLPAFEQAISDAQASSIDLLRDVELNVKIELGRSRMLVEDVLKLAEGSVVELDKLAGDPVDVFVNDRLVARGEVLVLNDNFCVRVNEIMAAAREEA